jgi:hypothetical protein
MAIFAVIQQPGANAEKLAPAVAAVYAGANYPLGNGVWLVPTSGTAEEVSNKLGITPEATVGAAVVIEVASYFGRANPAIWSWIKANWEARPVG